MQKVVGVTLQNGRQIIILPEGITVSGDPVAATQDERTGEVTLSPMAPSKEGDWESFFQLLDEVGPVPDDFMEWRERENALYAELAEQVDKPATLDRFFQVQREVGPGENDFLADRGISDPGGTDRS